ncbi:MAG: hypothetical protein WD877_01320 [Candidatus Saccharimonadales bacterium]
MEILIGLAGLIVGLFLWSNIYGGLFATLPIVMKLKKSGDIKQIKWGQLLGSVVLASLILLAAAIWVKPFFAGAVVAGAIMLFNIGKLRGEARENIKRDYPEISSHDKK